MFLKQTLPLGVLLSAATFNAHALTTAYTSAGKVGLVYSSVSNVTWTQDANLFKTMYDANDNLINQIANVTSSYNDPYLGVQTVDAGDFNTSNGRMNWWGAQAFVDYLNSIDYGGSNQWHLPSSGSNPPVGYNQTGSELGQLFYSELGGTAGSNIPDTDIFNNEQPYQYWSGTEYVANPINAWNFITDYGYQVYNHKTSQLNVWAISPGQVPAAVPVPAAAWLFGPALLSLLSVRRRGYAE